VKTMSIALVKVHNAINVGNVKYTTSTVYVAKSYFVGFVIRSSIKVSIYLFEF
jgi:hypothetical protein